MMQTLVGFAFTVSELERLHKQGFAFDLRASYLEKGYRQYNLAPSFSQGLAMNLEIRQIIDEDLYFSFEKNKDFSPFIYDSEASVVATANVHESLFVHQILDQTMDDCELRQFLSIRKSHSIWAVVLKCNSYSDFRARSKPDREMNLGSHPAMIFHQGSTCYDLIVI